MVGRRLPAHTFNLPDLMHSHLHFQRHVLPDIERNGFCFSDGVGQISHELLHDVLQRVPFVREDEHITAIQVIEIILYRDRCMVQSFVQIPYQHIMTDLFGG